MSRNRFRHQFDENYVPSPGIVIEGESLTIPDQSMTIQEILLRYARGLGAPAAKPMFFSGDEYRPDLDAMSETDKVDLYRAVVADAEAKQAEYNALRDKRLKGVREAREKELRELADLRQRIADFDSRNQLGSTPKE